jgi:hypothetical protein
MRCGRVELVEQTGAQNHLEVTAAGTLITTVDNSLRPVPPDSDQTFHIGPANIFVFAPDDRG